MKHVRYSSRRKETPKYAYHDKHDIVPLHGMSLRKVCTNIDEECVRRKQEGKRGR
jgi:hypothetical protein